MTGLVIERGDLRIGEARGRYFRENFAQGGVDLVQMIPELVRTRTRRSPHQAVSQAGSCCASLTLTPGF